MELRTITVGAREGDWQRAAQAAQDLRTVCAEAGIVVQTLRAAPTVSGFNSCADVVSVARAIEERALDLGFDYATLGVVPRDRLPQLPDAMAATQAVFASVNITHNGAVDDSAVAQMAEMTHQLARDVPGGVGNLRVAALAMVPAGSPFFPAAWHDGGAPWLAIGPEAAALAWQATQPLADVPHDAPQRPALVAIALQRLAQMITDYDQRLRQLAEPICQRYGITYAGCDWSLAPHPLPDRSIAAAVEHLTGVPFGHWGTLAGVRALTATIRQCAVTQLGFSGVMLPVVEDSRLAQRALQHCYTLRDLLAFSAVCGTGLDTIPLAGDVDVAVLAGIYREVATLATTLHKPLTARLMPLAGHQIGDTTRFAELLPPPLAQFFCEARVLA
jgi:uncharacterized protein (UPF0210 family)